MKKTKLALLLIAFATFSVACNPYGKKVTSGNIEVYYKSTSEVYAKKLAQYLEKEVKPESTVSYQTYKEDDINHVLMVTQAEYRSTVTTQLMEEIAVELSWQVFDNNPVVFHIADEELNSLRQTQPIYHDPALDN